MSERDLSGAVLDGRYQVIEPIAEGAMGSVYRGERLKLGRAVAIKIMHDALPDELASRQRFEREAKLMARLEHPHCVSVIDFGVHDDKPFLVMDLVRGTSLIDLLEKTGRFQISRAIEILRQVLSGLGHAHELGIVHRDIKPANIMLAEKTGLGEQIRILDFGLARPATESVKLTTGIVVGTPNYMAPEQIKGGEIDGRTDLYACGVMLFELVTGQKPFVADDPISVVRKHLHDPPPRLADQIPDVDLGDLEAIVARALGKLPDERFATAAEMSAALEQVAAARNSRPTLAPAELMGRAVPQISTGPSTPQVATASGWSLPASSDASVRDPSVPPADVRDSSVPSVPPADVRDSSVPSVPPADVRDSSVPSVPPADVRDSSVPNPSVPNPAVRDSSVPNALPPTRRGSQSRIVTAPVTKHPIAQIPLTRNQLLIAGGVLGLVLVMIIAATRGDGAKAQTPIDAGVAQVIHVDAASSDSVAPTIGRVADLYSAGELEPALDVVNKARRQHPESAQLAFLGGKIYFAKLWWTDGIKSFRDAIRLDPGYRSDPELIKIAVRGFVTTPDTNAQLADFLFDDVGAMAKPALEEVARMRQSAAINARLAAEIRRFN